MTRAVELMLDSGAYGAWTSGKPIKVKDYIKFVREFEDCLWGYINLDELPGRFGKPRSEEQVDKAAKASYKNLQIMKDAGLKPMPVFHRGEKWEHLERLLKDGETYIGLSPLVDSREAEKKEWLDECFTLLTNRTGVPFVRTHGFGVTNPAWMIRYPWYSVDSTTWVKTGGFGIIPVPPPSKDGIPDYSRLPMRIHISDIVKKKGTGYSFHNMTPMEQKYIEEWFVGHKFNFAELLHSRYERCALVLCYYHGLVRQKRLPFRNRWKHLRSHSFPADVAKLLKPMEDFQQFYCFHSTNVSNDQGSLLTRGKSPHRLLSYFELRDYPPEKIRQYVKYGMEDPKYTRTQPPVQWDGRRYTIYRRIKLLDRVESPDENLAN